jgi:hypothetical protein
MTIPYNHISGHTLYVRSVVLFTRQKVRKKFVFHCFVQFDVIWFTRIPTLFCWLGENNKKVFYKILHKKFENK